MHGDSGQKLRAMRSVKSISFLAVLSSSGLWRVRKIFGKYIPTSASCTLYFSRHMFQLNYIRWNSWRRQISNWQIGRNLNYSSKLISYYMRCNVGPVNVMVNAEFTNHCNERRCFAALRNNLVRKQTVMTPDLWIEESRFYDKIISYRNVNRKIKIYGFYNIIFYMSIFRSRIHLIVNVVVLFFKHYRFKLRNNVSLKKLKKHNIK